MAEERRTPESAVATLTNVWTIPIPIWDSQRKLFYHTKNGIVHPYPIWFHGILQIDKCTLFSINHYLNQLLIGLEPPTTIISDPSYLNGKRM